jgi:DNA repair exonuclease SbcCD ATPase subunit
MIEECKRLRNHLNKLIGKQELLKENLKDTLTAIEDSENYLLDLKQARLLAQTVAETTQQQLEFHISNLVTMALDSVFADAPEFKVKFVQRRNKTECDLLFVKNGIEYNPTEGGGGPLDVASFALRIATWSLKKTRNVQILDEPMKFVSRDLQEKVSEMVKMISEKLNLQIIMVSHIPELIECADKIITVQNAKGVAKVKG